MSTGRGVGDVVVGDVASVCLDFRLGTVGRRTSLSSVCNVVPESLWILMGEFAGSWWSVETVASSSGGGWNRRELS